MMGWEYSCEGEEDRNKSYIYRNLSWQDNLLTHKGWQWTEASQVEFPKKKAIQPCTVGHNYDMMVATTRPIIHKISK